MKALSIVVLLVLLFSSACGGEESETLHMEGYDISADDYEAYIAATLSREPVGASVFCGPMNDLKTDQAKETYLREWFKDVESGTEELPTGATEVPDQEVDEESTARAVRIIIDACSEY